MSIAVVTFLVVLACVLAAHDIADHWLQSDHQARTKAAAGWPGHRACAAHVACYTATQLFTMLAVCWWLSVPLSGPGAVLGVALSALTHYVIDRRAPLRWLAEHLGNGAFYRLNAGGLNGAYLLDQSAHRAVLFVTALLCAAPF